MTTLSIAGKTVDMTLQGLREHYNNLDFTPAQLMAALRERASQTDNPIWIYPLTEAELLPYVERLHTLDRETAPLWGVPFAIKDNIDLAGVPTTAGCEAFRYVPQQSATVVTLLLEAGALPLGKTNMDQFATGLVGTRSPWGACRNAFDPSIISGGSSSGSAVAVALGLASFSLGTDTAGSGRVPASLNNLVGLKPSRGLFSNRGVVPACRSLDCVSVFALNSDDANTVFDVAARFDPSDSYARKNPYTNSGRYYKAGNPNSVLGIPAQESLAFFNNQEANTLFSHCCDQLREAGFTLKEIDFSPFIEAAQLLYQGPWVAERWLATQSIITDNPEAMLPVIQNIIAKGNSASATDTFTAQYQLQALKQRADKQLQTVDAIITPTNGTYYAIDDVNRDPIPLNSNLGYYTNFMNLLDYSAVAVPVGFYRNTVGFGITLFHQAMQDKKLLSISASLQNLFKLPAGTTDKITPRQGNTTLTAPYDTIDVVVCGAHMEGLPLNWQLRERGAELRKTTTTSDHYRLYVLPGKAPLRPALVRSSEKGSPIYVEVWRLPANQFGSFVNEIPQPLGIGKVALSDGRWVTGFICDQWGLKGATDITPMKSWKTYLQHLGQLD